jgi:hypothetical protein
VDYYITSQRLVIRGKKRNYNKEKKDGNGWFYLILRDEERGMMEITKKRQKIAHMMEILKKASNLAGLPLPLARYLGNVRFSIKYDLFLRGIPILLDLGNVSKTYLISQKA